MCEEDGGTAVSETLRKGLLHASSFDDISGISKNGQFECQIESFDSFVSVSNFVRKHQFGQGLLFDQNISKVLVSAFRCEFRYRPSRGRRKNRVWIS